MQSRTARTRTVGVLIRKVARSLLVSLATISPVAPVQRLAAQISTQPVARYTRDDVAFMQGMIMHHSQGLIMTSMVHERTNRDDVHALADRLAESHQSEITLMQQWLASRGEKAPVSAAASDGHTGHSHGAPTMPKMAGLPDSLPGMANQDRLDELEHMRGLKFDTALVASLIDHQQGTLTMVMKLKSSANSGQEPELGKYLTTIEVKSPAEVKQLKALLDALRKP